MNQFVARVEGLLLLFVVAVGAFGVAVPGPGRAIDRAGAIDPTLAVLVLTTGLSINAAALSATRCRWARLLTVLAVSTAALPLLAWGVGHLVTGPVHDGVLAVGVAPSEVASVGLVGLAGGEVTVAAALLSASCIVTVLAAGPVLGLLAHAPALHPVGLLATLGLVVAVPLVVGAGLRQGLHPGERTLDVGRLVGLVTLLGLLWEVASEVELRAAYAIVTVALAAFLAGAAGLGRLLSWGLPPQAEPGVLLPVAMRDFAVAAGIATAAFGPSATGPLGIYGFLVLLFGAGAVRLGSSRWSGRGRAR
ncbi:MAG: bile acid:sodium symporter [Acidimicrobiales bacterium]